jgi:hypothetical protein
MLTLIAVLAVFYVIYRLHAVEQNLEGIALLIGGTSIQLDKSVENLSGKVEVEAQIIRRYLGGLIENDLLPHVGFKRPTNRVEGDEKFYEAWREEVLDKL